MAANVSHAALEGHAPVACPGFDAMRWPDMPNTATVFSMPVDDVEYIYPDNQADESGLPSLPLTTEGFDFLRAKAVPSAVGKGRTTVMDTTVRKSNEIKLGDTDIDFRVNDYLLDEALKAPLRKLALPGFFSPKPHKMVFYEPGDFFAAHEDSDHGHSSSLAATIIVELPMADDSSTPSTALRVQVNNTGPFVPVFADLPAAHIKVCVMTKGVLHSVEAVDRRRVVVTFDLLRVNGPERHGVIGVEPDLIKILPQLMPPVHMGLDTLRDAGVTKFGIMCTHRYSDDTDPLTGLDLLMKQCIELHPHVAKTSIKSVVLWDSNGVITSEVFAERSSHDAFDTLMSSVIDESDIDGDTDKDEEEEEAPRQKPKKAKPAAEKAAVKFDWEPRTAKKRHPAYRRKMCLGDVCFVATPDMRPMATWDNKEDVYLGNQGFEGGGEIRQYRAVMGTFRME
jgi:hypothetical protein